MVHVTERAKEALFRRRASLNLDSRDTGLRLARGPGGHLRLVVDRMKAGDEIVRHKESAVLLVDSEISAFVVAGRSVDCRQARDGTEELILKGSRPRRGPVRASVGTGALAHVAGLVVALLRSGRYQVGR
jgi:hypothetical protein